MIGVLAVTVVIATGCSTAVPTGTPGVDQVGSAVVRYRGPEVEMVLGYRFAAANLGEDWLILDLAVTGATGEAVEIDRADISLRTPGGDVIPLATQEEFGKEFRRLEPTIRRSAVAGDPLDYWAGRMPCDTQLFTAPGEGVAFDSLTVNDRRICYGKIFFLLPAGVQAGAYVLVVDLPETTIRVPFKLGD
jgi:hypothetical protein